MRYFSVPLAIAFTMFATVSRVHANDQFVTGVDNGIIAFATVFIILLASIVIAYIKIKKIAEEARRDAEDPFVSS